MFFYCFLNLYLVILVVFLFGSNQTIGLEQQEEGACQNLADKTAWESKKSLMRSDLEACGRQCWGASSCVSTCLRKLDGYSKPCSHCFGELVSCTRSKCKTKCYIGPNDVCKECINQYCTPTFCACSGIPESDIPDGNGDLYIEAII